MKELQSCSLNFLIGKFGKFGYRLFLLARGQDQSEVLATRPRKSLSKERTFSSDLSLKEVEDFLPELVSVTYRELKSVGGIPRTFSIKIRTSDFKTLSKQTKIDYNSLHLKDLERNARALIAKLDNTEHTKYRLLGTSFSDFTSDLEPDQKRLF